MKQAGDSLPPLDLYSYYLPGLIFAKESIRNGSLPLWSPYQAVGHPFFAGVSYGLFYPITWLILLMDVPHAMLAIQFLDVAIGMLGMVLFMRHLQVKLPGAILAAVYFGQVVLTESFILACGSTLAWLPLILWSAHRQLTNPTAVSFAILAFSLAVSYFGGHPQYFYYILIIFGLYSLFISLFHYYRLGFRISVTRMCSIGCALLLAIGMVSIQLLPSLELSFSSVRQLGERLNQEDSFMRGGGPMHIYHSYISFFGSALFFLPFGFLDKRYRKTACSLAGCLMYLLLFVLSKEISAIAFFGNIPLSESFRIHGRFLFIGSFILAALLGIGFSSFFDKAPLKIYNGEARRIRIEAVLIVAFLVIILFPLHRQTIALVRNSSLFLSMFLPWVMILSPFYWFHSPYSPGSKIFGMSITALLITIGIIINRSILVLVVPHVLFLVILLIVILMLFWRHNFPPLILRLIPSVLLIVLLFVFIPRQSMTVPALSKAAGLNFELDERVHWVKQHGGIDRVLLAGNHIFNPNIGYSFGFYNIDSYDPFTLSRWSNFIRFSDPERFDELTAKSLFYGFVTLNGQIQEMFLRQSQLLGMLSLRFLLIDEPLQQIPGDNNIIKSWELVHGNINDHSQVYVYENKYAMPRVYLVREYVIAHSENESLKMIRKNFSRLENLAIIENAQPSFASAPSSQEPGWVENIRIDTNEIDVKLEATGPALLVLTDSYYPGWKAFVDAEDTPIWRANSLFKAVEVGPGVHEIKFKYSPMSLSVGAAVSSVSMIILVSVLMWALQRKIKSKHCSE